MSYVPPNLSLDVVLLEQVLAVPDLSLDVVLCAPSTPNVYFNVSASATLQPFADLSLQIFETPSSYVPPPLSVLIALNEQVLPAPYPLDIVLCKPVSNGNDVNIAIIANAQLDATANASFEIIQPEPVAVAVTAVAILAPVAALDIGAEAYVVGLSANIVAELQPKASVSMTYDVNVFRGAQSDMVIDIQRSKLKGIDKSGSFENGRLNAVSGTDNKETARLLSVDSQAQFEANVKLTTSERLLSEQSRLIGTSSKHQGEYHKFLAIKDTLKNENAKLIGKSDWLSFDAMLARQTERKIEGEYSYLDAIMRHNDIEHSRLVGYQYCNLIETAKLPSWFTSYIVPALWQTVILKQQIAAPTLPLDVVLCRPKSQAPRSKLIILSGASLSAIALLELTVDSEVQPQPQTGVIFVTNSVSLVRSDDGREIKLLGFSVGIDSNSYTWSFSATVPLSELSKVDTAHEQRIGVNFTCNGNLWRFILDSCDDSASFGESSLTIKGKSRAMLLAHPYATQRGFKFDTAMSARQIADAELNRGGVPSGFTLDWQLAGVNGWNVPANTYSYTGKTPINSLQWIAEAAGGFINADMSADVLHVLAHYPVPSWEWAAQTPSINLPMSLITSRSRGRINKPSYNGVTLYGENDNGIGALIKRTGTSGGYQPPMITSDLMTDTAAAISRGKMILSDTGDIGNIGISMPLVADIGVLKPSTLIGVNDGESWVGMVRGTTITGRLSSNRALEIDQSIDVERHFDKEIV